MAEQATMTVLLSESSVINIYNMECCVFE